MPAPMAVEGMEGTSVITGLRSTGEEEEEEEEEVDVEGGVEGGGGGPGDSSLILERLPEVLRVKISHLVEVWLLTLVK